MQDPRAMKAPSTEREQVTRAGSGRATTQGKEGHNVDEGLMESSKTGGLQGRQSKKHVLWEAYAWEAYANDG